ncbi:hypothetical protein DPSP01_006404 [Paraphaeosphaeria sporulosa]|uniref:Uncharacterized protein n=1 Tax=Paraphaeosphaeria sporulosa TaxID=1460663 RepID=A0A177BVK1_9PLEO|nr:uncharacterized protein CC84DRAFT_1105554 [Paraphaeosphaeria sporulosa]OAF98751.1 hypothetical protein CC84DRAFT_1105554 [Paraphaeosphaeria sporulosa]
MYRRGDPRWNRTLQNISDTVEHANESAQEGLYSFAHAYITPCLSSLTQCANACTAPCFPSHNDRRRHRARSRGRAEQSFDFYDDWDGDEDDGLLGWGHDNLDRLWGATANYGTTSQPSRPRAMSYGDRNRNRDPRFTRPRRKSAVPPHDGGPDPTIIPSSSYFGFLGRLPFRLGGKVLRYRPSAADLTEHPGQARRSYDEAQPLIEGSDDDGAEAQHGSDIKTHGRKRSQTNASGHTTDSFSSRGDIFPSEDELDDAVPLDDEFAVALERRTTGQWYDDASSGKDRAPSGSKSKRPSASRLSTKSTSSRNIQDPGRNSHEANVTRLPLEPTDEATTLTDLQHEEEQLRLQEEAEVHRRRQEAQQLAVRRGLTAAHQHLPIPRRLSPSPSSTAPPGQMGTPSTTLSPFFMRTTGSETCPDSEPALSPFPVVDTQTMPDSSSFHVDESDYSSLATTPNRPLSLKDEARDKQVDNKNSNFVPARLPHFDAQPS